MVPRIAVVPGMLSLLVQINRSQGTSYENTIFSISENQKRFVFTQQGQQHTIIILLLGVTHGVLWEVHSEDFGI